MSSRSRTRRPPRRPPVNRPSFWVRMVAFVLALALAAWLVEVLIATVLRAAAH